VSEILLRNKDFGADGQGLCGVRVLLKLLLNPIHGGRELLIDNVEIN
jgi:hypothetical protein